MTKEKERELTNKYPNLYRYPGWDNISGSLMAFGFECNDGWFSLIDTLSQDISEQLELRDGATVFPGVRRLIRKLFYTSEGIPRKLLLYGWLRPLERWTYTYKGEFRVLQVKEKFGGLRYYVEGGDKAIESFIRFAERSSYKICEDCGQGGDYTKEYKENRVITDNPCGWTFTKCVVCWAEYLSTVKKFTLKSLGKIIETIKKHGK